MYGAQAWTAAARLAILAEVEVQNKDALRVAIRNGKAGVIWAISSQAL